jgi:hypothetical protein
MCFFVAAGVLVVWPLQKYLLDLSLSRFRLLQQTMNPTPWSWRAIHCEASSFLIGLRCDSVQKKGRWLTIAVAEEGSSAKYSLPWKLLFRDSMCHSKYLITLFNDNLVHNMWWLNEYICFYCDEDNINVTSRVNIYAYKQRPFERILEDACLYRKMELHSLVGI